MINKLKNSEHCKLNAAIISEGISSCNSVIISDKDTFWFWLFKYSYKCTIYNGKEDNKKNKALLIAREL